MAVAFVRKVTGLTAEQYDRITAEVSAILGEGNLPEGGLLHLAGPVEGGWMIVEAWESEEALNRYRAEVLGPASTRAGVPTPPGPVRSAFAVHKLIGRLRA